MNTLDNPIIRVSSHAGKDYPIAILTNTFVSATHGDARVQVLDVDKGEVFEASLDWLRLHTRPAYRSSDPDRTEREDRIVRALAASGHGSPEFDRGATDPMKSWMERNAQLT